MKLYSKVIKKLIIQGISTSVAESCTGGLLSYKITSIPGVSKIYHVGLIVYSNKSKSSILNISSNSRLIRNKFYYISNKLVCNLLVRNFN